MSVSVRSSQARALALSNTRHSETGKALRSSAAQQITSRHANTETKFNPGGRTQSMQADKKNTAVITLDELQRIRQQCTQNSFGSTLAYTAANSNFDFEDEQ